ARSRHREPHARGDGPSPVTTVVTGSLRAPRTWGWTAGSARPGRFAGESPTHVGMDREARQECMTLVGEPHARGDGPSGISPDATRRPRAPRTWGWTSGVLRTPEAEWESPTHVGMD